MINTTHRKYDAPGKYNVTWLSSFVLRNIVSNSNSPVVITRVLMKALPGVENGVNSPYTYKDNMTYVNYSS